MGSVSITIFVVGAFDFIGHATYGETLAFTTTTTATRFHYHFHYHYRFHYRFRYHFHDRQTHDFSSAHSLHLLGFQRSK